MLEAPRGSMPLPPPRSIFAPSGSSPQVNGWLEQRRSAGLDQPNSSSPPPITRSWAVVLDVFERLLLHLGAARWPDSRPVPALLAPCGPGHRHPATRAWSRGSKCRALLREVRPSCPPLTSLPLPKPTPRLGPSREHQQRAHAGTKPPLSRPCSTVGIFVLSGLALKGGHVAQALTSWGAFAYGVAAILLFTPMLGGLVLKLGIQPQVGPGGYIRSGAAGYTIGGMDSGRPPPLAFAWVNPCLERLETSPRKQHCIPIRPAHGPTLLSAPGATLRSCPWDLPCSAACPRAFRAVLRSRWRWEATP